MAIILFKKGLVHQINEIMVEPRRYSFSGEGIQRDANEDTYVRLQLTQDEIEACQELVHLLISSADLAAKRQSYEQRRSSLAFEEVLRQEADECRRQMTDKFSEVTKTYFKRVLRNGFTPNLLKPLHKFEATLDMVFQNECFSESQALLAQLQHKPSTASPRNPNLP